MRWRATQGSVNIPNLLILSVVVVFLTAMVWTARTILMEIELQQAVQIATHAMASEGCWDSTVNQDWSRAVAVYPLSTVAQQIQFTPATTLTYTGYGQVVTVDAQVAVPFWWGDSAAGSPTITWRAIRQAVSLAPTVDLNTSCQTPPGYQ
ncbi:hypothetical protein [Sulfobacillus thermosulfidooxidans]|uniref:hypothetical protein n=1 Tax=Sulfobacillus thermosulfidooxidans TaxID=28034 RepID=UPI000378E5CF|nr:hypothetical protein [Sulfobacillus thermosulfidooxidans]